MNIGTVRALIVLLTMVALMTGCATTRLAEVEETDADPLELVNRQIYSANDFIDRNIGEPVATAYIKYTPRPVRKSVSNFFDHVKYPNTILNSFLQGKTHQGFHDLRRFFVNSTFGLFGIWDMATPLGLQAHSEDFGQTLSTWGVDEVAYLVLPLLGPSTIRDAPDLGVGTVTNILFYVSNPYVIPVAILGFVDKRARADEALKFRNETAIEPYLFTREAYRQHRTFLTRNGHLFIDDDVLFDETLLEPDADETQPLQEDSGVR